MDPDTLARDVDRNPVPGARPVRDPRVVAQHVLLAQLAHDRGERRNDLVDLVNDELLRISGKRVDPLLIKSLMWAMESVSIEFLRDGKPVADSISHGQQVMMAIAEASFERAVQGPS